MRARRFNDQGVEEFRLFLKSTREGEAPRTDRTTLESDLKFSALVDPPISFEVREFENREEAGLYFFKVLDQAGHDGLATDVGFWTWMALAYFDHLTIKKKDDTESVRADDRYILDPNNFRHFYRHFLNAPYRIVAAHKGDSAIPRVLLTGALTVPGEVAEQLSSSQADVSSPKRLKLITSLYLDDSGKLKRGSGGKDAGSPRRLKAVLGQLSLNWDIDSQTTLDTLEMLPAEFNRFIKGRTGSTAERKRKSSPKPKGAATTRRGKRKSQAKDKGPTKRKRL